VFSKLLSLIKRKKHLIGNKRRFKFLNKLSIYIASAIIIVGFATLTYVLNLYHDLKKDSIHKELVLMDQFLLKNQVISIEPNIKSFNTFLSYPIVHFAFLDDDGSILKDSNNLNDLQSQEIATLFNLHKGQSSIVSNLIEGPSSIYGVFKQHKHDRIRIYILDKTRFKEDIKSFTIRLSFFLLILTIGLIMLSLYLLKKSLLPLRKIQHLTRKINRGKFEKLETYDYGDEREHIISSVNDLSSKLQSNQKFLKTYSSLLNMKFNLLEQKKKELEFKNQLIKSGLQYAQLIQSEILNNYDHQYSTDHLDWFSILKPLDIVSGDFYQIINKTIDRLNYTFIAVADCTGHGTQAALLTITANNILKQTIEEIDSNNTGDILQTFNKKFVSSLSKRNITGNDLDYGLDIGLIAINHATNEVNFSGAYRPCIIKRDKEIIRLRPNRISIGFKACDLVNPKIRERSKLTTETFQLKKGDHIYLFSDGITDQFEKSNKKKYTINRLLDDFKAMNDESIFDSKHQLNKLFNQWQGDTPQTDDQVLIGIKITS
tara:strand:- start:272 stop:1903 length:1632 start_codon:yes stop_codon:yes gene_type:complete